MPYVWPVCSRNELRTMTVPRSTAETPATLRNDSTPFVSRPGYSIPSMYFTPSFCRISYPEL